MPSHDITMPVSGGAQDEDVLRAGMVFDRFLIVDKVGEGAVGEVFSAYDPNLDRRVALKVLRDGTTDGDAGSGSEAGQGLLQEAKALAQLTHPHVVTVYEVGEDNGRAYIVMELVEGVDLGAWLQAETRGWRAAVSTMLQAGEGLAAAHARGTIHRDFKPANVLVGSDGRARVGDFGLAMIALQLPASDVRSTGTLQTQSGRLIGTPYFMAPELFDGVPHSVASDVYAYCVALYEAAVGGRPFSADTVVALQMAKQDKVRVEAQGDLPPQLRQAIARGLDPDPQARWPSMEPLLDVLRRCLQPRQTQGWWIAGGAGALLLAGVLAAPSSPPLDVCTGGEARTDAAWASGRRAAVVGAIDASPVARASKADVLTSLDDFVARWEREHRGACESARRGERSDRALDAAMACLDRSIAEFETFTGLLASADSNALVAAPTGLSALSDPTSCGRPGRVDGVDPPPASISAAVESVDADVARVRGFVAAGSFDVALEDAEKAVERAVELGYGPLEARAHFWFGRAHVERGRPSVAARALEDALWMGHRSAEPEVPARAALELARLLAGTMDRPAEARRFFAYAEAEVARRELDGLRPELERVRAMFLRLQRDDVGLIAAHEKAIALLPEGVPLQRADHLSSYAADLGRLGRLPEAIEHLNEALRILEEEVGDAHPLYAEALGRLGLALRIQGDLDQALELTERALEIQISARGPRHDAVAFQRRRLADFYWRIEALPKAITEFERVVELDEALFEPPNRFLASDLTELASLYASVSRNEDAARTFEKALAAYGPDAPRDTVADTRCKYGALLFNAGRPDEAAAETDAGLKLLEGATSVGSLDAIRQCARSRAFIAMKTGDATLAADMAERAFTVTAEQVGPDHPSLVRELLFVAQAYETAGDTERAATRLERAIKIAVPESEPNLLAMVEVALARLVAKRGEQDRARSLVEAALDRVEDDGPSAADIRLDGRELLETLD